MEKISQIFNSINVRVDPTYILDCFRLGRLKLQQTRPRPILVKLQCSIDDNAILANKSTLSSPLSIKPDILLLSVQSSIESALLKQCWQLIQAGHDHRQIKFSSNCMYVNGKVFGQITDGEFRHSVNYQLHPPQSLQHKDNIQHHLLQWINNNYLMLISQQMFPHSLPDNILKQNHSTSNETYDFTGLKVISLNCQGI